MVAPLQRSLPDVGEFAHTQLLTAICIGLALPLRRAAIPRPDVRFWERNGSGRPLADAFKRGPRACTGQADLLSRDT